jgi:hypothetical protein
MCEILISNGIVRAGFDLEEDCIVFKGEKRVPQARARVHRKRPPPGIQENEPAIHRIALSVEGHISQRSLQYDYRFRLRGRQVPMRTDVTAGLNSIEHALQVIFITQVKSMDFALSLAFRGIFRLPVEQHLIDKKDRLMAGTRRNGRYPLYFRILHKSPPQLSCHIPRPKIGRITLCMRQQIGQACYSCEVF